MKVSIIIPIYNAENHLDKCISSASRQTHEDIEIILVNDGSTDSSEKICRSFCDKNSRIRLINCENAGVSAARNKGLDIASGSLITFIDSDDYVESDYVEYLVNLITQSNSDIACCQHEENVTPSDSFLIKGTTECLKAYLATNTIFPAVWGKIYRKELFDGIRFPEGKRFEDNYILFRLLDRCNSVMVGNLRKYYYISNNESFVNQVFSESQMQIVDVMMVQRDFIEKKYPSLTLYANALVVYAANRCLLKMADSGVYDKNAVERLKPLYKAYGKDFLKGNSSKSAKMFYRVTRISPKLSMWFYRLTKKH